MGGYSCLRQFSGALGKEVYGKITIPSTYAGICPGDTTGDASQNVVPEIFFGFYTTNGLDIGIRVGGGGKWRPFCYGNTGICTAHDGDFMNTIGPSNLLYMRAWIENVGTKYYAKLNVSKISYSGTDLMSTPFTTEITDTNGVFNYKFTSGYTINREMTIAANPASYETSGTYMTNAKFGPCGVVTPGNVTYIWMDANSTLQSGTGAKAGASGRLCIKLRKDGGTYLATRIKLIAVTNPAEGATETVSIDFRNPPII